MQVCFKSEAGSIRDNNHDFVLYDRQLGLVIIVGGVNLEDQDEAKVIASSIAIKLKEFHSVVTPDDARNRLVEVFSASVALNAITGTGNFISALWLVDSYIVGASIGKSAVIALFGDQSILVSGHQTKLEDSKLSIQSFDCQKIMSGNRIVIVSEGITRSVTPRQLYSRIVENISDENISPVSILNISKKVYDGDDNTVVLIQFTATDTKKNTPEEIVLKTHFDKQFSIKIWQPMVIFAGLFVASALMFKKGYAQIMRVTKILALSRKRKNRK